MSFLSIAPLLQGGRASWHSIGLQRDRVGRKSAELTDTGEIQLLNYGTDKGGGGGEELGVA